MPRCGVSLLNALLVKTAFTASLASAVMRLWYRAATIDGASLHAEHRKRKRRQIDGHERNDAIKRETEDVNASTVSGLDQNIIQI